MRSSQEARDPYTFLPPEIWLDIFEYLDYSTLTGVAFGVCKRFRWLLQPAGRISRSRLDIELLQESPLSVHPRHDVKFSLSPVLRDRFTLSSENYKVPGGGFRFEITLREAPRGEHPASPRNRTEPARYIMKSVQALWKIYEGRRCSENAVLPAVRCLEIRIATQSDPGGSVRRVVPASGRAVSVRDVLNAELEILAREIPQRLERAVKSAKKCEERIAALEDKLRNPRKLTWDTWGVVKYCTKENYRRLEETAIRHVENSRRVDVDHRIRLTKAIWRLEEMLEICNRLQRRRDAFENPTEANEEMKQRKKKAHKKKKR